MVKYMYYNKREKYFVSEYFYKNKIGCVQKIVDANEKLVKEMKDGTNTISK